MDLDECSAAAPESRDLGKCSAAAPDQSRDLAEVLRLIRDCCYLQAKRKYDELVNTYKLPEGWLPSDDAGAKEAIERMIQRERECLQVLHDVSFDESKWILASTNFGITCHYQVEEDGIVQVRIEGSLADLPMFEQACVIHEVDYFKTWIPFCNDSQTVDKIGYADIVALISLFIPPIGRDTLVYAYAADCLHESNKIIISGKSIESWKDTPLRPTGWFHDRMDIQKFLATIEVTSPISAKTCIIAKVDPRTILPKSLVNIVVRNLAGLMLYFFQNKVKEVVKHPEGDHAKRIRENPHFYKEWLLPKLIDYCSAKGWDRPTADYWPNKEDSLPPST